MAVVTPLNNFLGPEGDTVTVDKQLLNTEYWNQPIIYQKMRKVAVYLWHNLWALPILGKVARRPMPTRDLRGSNLPRRGNPDCADFARATTFVAKQSDRVLPCGPAPRRPWPDSRW